MMKDVRKAFGTSWRSQFLQGVIFEDFHQKYGFPVPRLRAAPLFAFLLAAQFVFEFTVLQLTEECFAPPSAMICAVAMSSADSGMGVGSSSFYGAFLLALLFKTFAIDLNMLASTNARLFCRSNLRFIFW